jgi:predicted Zn-dependent protease
MSERMELADLVLGYVGDRAEAEVQIGGGTSALTRFANSFIHQNVGEEGDAVSLRVAVDGRVASATTTNVDREALRRFVDDTLDRAALQPVDEDWPGPATATEPSSVDHYDDATAAATPADRAERVAAFVDAGPGMRAAGYCQTGASHHVFANTAGVRHEGRYTSAILDGIHQTGTSAGSGHAASRRLDDIDADAVGALAAQRANDGLNAHDTKPGEYEVVLAPECVASIGIFLAFYGFNAKAHQEGQSFVELGADQFDPAVTLVDDITDPRAFGVGFDTEGTVRRRTELVRAGVSASLAHTRRTARKAGVDSTGHAVPGSDVWGPLATSMFFEGGTTSVGDLIAAVDRGLYVATFNYCRVLDPKTMAVTGLTRNGTFMIENGRITGAVTGLRFTQSFVDALGPGRVLGVGDDARFADSEFGPGMVHAPSLRLAAWNFTGGADG